MKLDWAALEAARERLFRRVAAEQKAREPWLETVRRVVAALDKAGYETGQVIDGGGAWPEWFAAVAPDGETMAVHVTHGRRDVQDLVTQHIRDCRVHLAEDLLARFCKAGEPVPQVVADWASTHGVTPADCPRCRDGS